MYVDKIDIIELQCRFKYKAFELHENLIESFELQQT